MQQTQTQTAHWRVPTVIILGFAAGLGFAIGHHCFYASLDGKPVDETPLSQQFNTAIGTAFAFLVRASLVIAVGAVYWQLFWESVARKASAISHLDSLTGALGSLFDLLYVRAFRGSPALGVLALLSWLLPFAMLLPPATLSVHSAAFHETVQERVSVPHMANEAMSASTQMWYAPDDYVPGTFQEWHSYYTTPSMQLSRLVAATASRGSVIDSPGNHTNATYTLTFTGPTVKCQEHTPDILRPFGLPSVEACMGESNVGLCSDKWAYVSWAPNRTTLVPYESKDLVSGTLPLNKDFLYLEQNQTHSLSYGGFEDDPVALFIATRGMGSEGAWSVLNCSLLNATYVTNMTSDSNRRVTPSLIDISVLDGVPDGSVSDTLAEPRGAMSEIDRTRFNYMAYMDSAGRLLLGTIFNRVTSVVRDTIHPTAEQFAVQPVDLMRTLLPFTAQLLPLTESKPQSRNQENWTPYPGFAYNTPYFNRSLGTATEELFQNITLSLLSEPEFARDSDENVDIFISRTQNAYFYNRTNLLLSYGLSLVLSFFACLVGCVSIFRGNVSYSNKFSTMLRTTRDDSIDTLVATEDRNGADPLPRYLAKAAISLGQSRSMREDKEVAMMDVKQRPNVSNVRSLMTESEEDFEESHLQPETHGWRNSSDLVEHMSSRTLPHEASQSHDWSEETIDRISSVGSREAGRS